MRILSLVLLLLITGCALSVGEERIVDREGDRELREGLRPPIYVGVSQPMPTEADALENAMQDARRQIVESLGIEICIETLETGTDSVQSGIVNRTLTTEDKSRIYARNIIKVSPERRYVEKWERMTSQGVTRYYKAWVAAPFREEEFRALWKETIRQFSRRFRVLESTTPITDPARIPELFLLYESVMAIEQEFLSQYWMIHLPEYQQFQDNKARLEGILRNLTTRMHIEYVAREGDLEGRLQYTVMLDETPIAGMPVRVISDVLDVDRVVFSSADGIIDIDYRFTGSDDAELLLVAGCVQDQSDVVQFLPSLRVTLPSPLNHHNITISLDIQTQPENTWLATELERRLQEQGFRVMQSTDSLKTNYIVQAEFRATSSDSSEAVFGYKAARSMLNLRLLNGSGSRTLLTFRLPNEEYRDTRGFGKSENEARQNALELRNLLLREEALRDIVRLVETTIDDRVKSEE